MKCPVCNKRISGRGTCPGCGFEVPKLHEVVPDASGLTREQLKEALERLGPEPEPEVEPEEVPSVKKPNRRKVMGKLAGSKKKGGK